MYYGDEFELSEIPEYTFLGLKIFTTIKNDFRVSFESVLTTSVSRNETAKIKG